MSPARWDVLKLLFYAAVVIACGAWLAPLFRNAGMALSEITTTKMTNGLIHWLGTRCAGAELSTYYTAALAASALVLFAPWLEFFQPGGKSSTANSTNIWFLNHPRGRDLAGGQPLMPRRQVVWETFASFLLAAGLFVPAVVLLRRGPSQPLTDLLLYRLPVAFAAAFAIEFFFRGLAQGIWLRAFKPWAAVAVSALFFTAVVAVVPWPGTGVAVDAEASWAGFGLLRELAVSLTSPAHLTALVLPVFVYGLLLGHARCRTASLAVPVGLQTAVILVFLIRGLNPPLPAPLVWFGLLILAVIAFCFTPKVRDGWETKE